MKLNNIIKDLEEEYIKGKENLKIDNISYDSRRIGSNGLFIAIEGFKTDGHKFIEESINNGAKAILIEKKLDYYRSDITYIKVKDSRKAMASVAANFYGNPQKELKLIGVTGTNGKTTTTYLIKSILQTAGFKTGLIGTIGNYIDEKELPSTRTTPNSLELSKLFRKMLDDGIEYVVMEVSSHALDLKRVYNLEFDVGVFTNISQDHLDYHKTLSEYIKVKSKLFQQVKSTGYSVINIDDKAAEKITKKCNSKIISYSLKNNSDYQAKEINLNAQGVSFSINNNDGKINLNITGKFNVYNALAAISVAFAFDINFEIVKKGLEGIDGIPGRFELVKNEQDFTLIVDYAHTADGMKNVLNTIEDLPKNRIIIVFGCGGDRDKEKRPVMGKVAANYGDYFIITTDNPRSEDPEAIIEDIKKGITNINKGYKVVIDRKDAIYEAINMAEKEDVIVIFGKGHETYQVFKDKTIHFDDREIAREAISSIKKGRI